MKTRTLTIRDSVWARNRRGECGGASLLNVFEIRQQCCLGILATAMGVPDDSIRGKGDPGDLDEAWPGFTDLDDEGICQAMNINDSHIFATTDHEKIEALRPIFKGWGWELDWRPNE